MRPWHSLVNGSPRRRIKINDLSVSFRGPLAQGALPLQPLEIEGGRRKERKGGKKEGVAQAEIMEWMDNEISHYCKTENGRASWNQAERAKERHAHESENWQVWEGQVCQREIICSVIYPSCSGAEQGQSWNAFLAHFSGALNRMMEQEHYEQKELWTLKFASMISHC